MADHRIDTCIKCQRKNQEIAAFDLCYACYRQEKRDLERGGAPLNRKLYREAKRVLAAYNKVIAGLMDLGASTELIREIRDLLEPLLDQIKEFREREHDGSSRSRFQDSDHKEVKH